jgi:hypothetical protein
MLHGDDLVFLQLLVRRGGVTTTMGREPSPRVRALLDSGHCTLKRMTDDGDLQLAVTETGKAAVVELVAHGN